jgi:hypothetical protein
MRCDGRSRTPAGCSNRPVGLLGGASWLPQPFQQTPIHAATVAGRPLPDSLRGLDLSRSRSAAWRASRTAPGAGLSSVPDFTTLYCLLQRLDDVIIDRVVGGGRCASCTARANQGGGVLKWRWTRPVWRREGQHVLCARDASSRAKTATLAALA